MFILCCFLGVYFHVSKRVKTTSPIDTIDSQVNRPPDPLSSENSFHKTNGGSYHMTILIVAINAHCILIILNGRFVVVKTTQKSCVF